MTTPDAKRGEPGLEQKVAWLSRRTAYPEKPRSVEVIQTHISWVFLTDRHAWKLKKPVRYDFLDFSTLEKRYEDCEREVRLNRRLAPDVYLGVVPLAVGADGELRLDRPGEPVDWLVKMRRLPEDRMLDRLIEEGRLDEDQVASLASVLIDFYRRTPPEPMTGEAYRRRFREDIASDREALARTDWLPEELVEDPAERLLGTLDENKELFTSRAEGKRVIEAHGDLRPQHACLIEPRPVVIDCLEFNRRFRILDPADELAYFAMETERLGAAWVGVRILEIYRRVTGDEAPAVLVDFYGRYRAYLRGKLAVWHVEDEEVDDQASWKERALWYLRRSAAGSR